MPVPVAFNKLPSLIEAADPPVRDTFPADKTSPSIVHPAILPALNNTREPVISPVCFTLKLLELIKRVWDESFISTPVVVKLWPSIVKLANFPPVNKTSEPVIWPLDFNIKLSTRHEVRVGSDKTCEKAEQAL